nr:hypothetical protein [Tanacetum cinerariifolium]
MDETTVRLWLKDQQDATEKLVRQQAEAFQLHLDTLRAELQATREYFSLLNTLTHQRLRIVGFNLEGVAAEWFRWMSWNGLITTCYRFVESVKIHFRLSKYEDPQRALSKLLQLASPKIKGSLNVDEDIGVDEVSSAIDDVFNMGESNVESMKVPSKFDEFLDNKKSVEEVVGVGERLGLARMMNRVTRPRTRVMMRSKTGTYQSSIHSLVTKARILPNCGELSVQRMSKCSLTKGLIKKSNTMFIP